MEAEQNSEYISKIVNRCPIEKEYYGNLLVADEVKLRRVNYYELKTQKGNIILESAYPGVIKNYNAIGSQHDIIVAFDMGDYAYSMKVRKKLVSKCEDEYYREEYNSIVKKIDALTKDSPRLKLLVKGLLPIIDIRAGILSKVDNIGDFLKKFEPELMENNERGPDIINWMKKFYGLTRKDIDEVIDEVPEDQIIYLTALIVETVGRIKIINSYDQGKGSSDLFRFENPTNQKWENYMIRYYYRLPDEDVLDMTYIL